MSTSDYKTVVIESLEDLDDVRTLDQLAAYAGEVAEALDSVRAAIHHPEQFVDPSLHNRLEVVATQAVTLQHIAGDLAGEAQSLRRWAKENAA